MLKKSLKVDLNIGEKIAFFAKRTTGRKPIFEQKVGGRLQEFVN